MIEVLRDCGALARLLPEVEALFGVPQRADYHPEVDTGVHTLMVIDMAARLGTLLPVRWAALTHDLGKAGTPAEVLPRHIGHEGRSLKLLPGLSQRLRVPGDCVALAELVAQGLGLGEALKSVPVIGPVLSLGLTGHNALVYLALALVPGVWWLLYRTRLGLRLRATGDNPAMVDAAGLSVAGLRYGALAMNGLLCALAGGYLVLAQNANFVPHMTAGRGYMALAAVIFGKWRPVAALWACLLFGFLDAVAIRLQGVALPAALGGGAVPVQAIQALPYLLTVVLLAGFIGHARAPVALGTPYLKER